ncbi:hypothetical protein JOC94_001382 [Bacillus thermophilus]|uniref:Uncharacterized protein n=1 Tax=Siminovitchia thermophila TaxID=1245522 RepID=A0ABS2R4T9_9BACI|nr:SE1832 family protein [Siminovitchia thermophila]MBM7714410.1 hypothetical protein [Siminovitchia thermophila]ONK25045.1 hypothetical protein BLX87_02435 [Bacillus sp. VT-16-64]
MKKSEIEYKIADIKADYVRLQHDLEKLEYVKGNLHPLERQLEGLEKELKKCYQLLDELELAEKKI